MLGGTIPAADALWAAMPPANAKNTQRRKASLPHPVEIFIFPSPFAAVARCARMPKPSSTWTPPAVVCCPQFSIRRNAVATLGARRHGHGRAFGLEPNRPVGPSFSTSCPIFRYGSTPFATRVHPPDGWPQPQLEGEGDDA